VISYPQDPRHFSQTPFVLPDFSKCTKFGASLQIAPWQIPHSSKISKGGEDTYFVSSDASSFGIFDGKTLPFCLTSGVGGWSNRGIDPREFSAAISTYCQEATDTQLLTEPRQILTYSHNKVISQATIGSWYREDLSSNSQARRVYFLSLQIACVLLTSVILDFLSSEEGKLNSSPRSKLTDSMLPFKSGRNQIQINQILRRNTKLLSKTYATTTSRI
jgi:hypothetical protein